jgi:hypothetical protein
VCPRRRVSPSPQDRPTAPRAHRRTVLAHRRRLRAQTKVLALFITSLDRALSPLGVDVRTLVMEHMLLERGRTLNLRRISPSREIAYREIAYI